MFSKLGGVFGTLPPRHVESANARLEIRRDESQSQNRKKDGEGEGEFTPVPWDDTAYVSIASLKAFLLSAVHTDNDLVTATPVHEASNTANARAASAYQSVGRAVHDSNIQAQTPPPESASTHVESHFTEGDLSRIRVFISDIIELERNGVTELAMQRSENFLDSIEAAIAAVKTA